MLNVKRNFFLIVQYTMATVALTLARQPWVRYAVSEAAIGIVGFLGYEYYQCYKETKSWNIIMNIPCAVKKWFEWW
jgi:hypothetical protein